MREKIEGKVGWHDNQQTYETFIVGVPERRSVSVFCLDFLRNFRGCRRSKLKFFIVRLVLGICFKNYVDVALSKLKT